jgi:hypothetical protein
VSKYGDEILKSILEDFANAGASQDDVEARALFRLLNYCPPPQSNTPLIEQPATPLSRT